jgi:hypothetical protein
MHSILPGLSKAHLFQWASLVSPDVFFIISRLKLLLAVFGLGDIKRRRQMLTVTSNGSFPGIDFTHDAELI